MVSQVTLKTKSDQQLKDGYHKLMADLMKLWGAIDEGESPTEKQEKAITDLENQIDKYIKEIEARGIKMPGWGHK